MPTDERVRGFGHGDDPGLAALSIALASTRTVRRVRLRLPSVNLYDMGRDVDRGRPRIPALPRMRLAENGPRPTPLVPRMADAMVAKAASPLF